MHRVASFKLFKRNNEPAILKFKNSKLKKTKVQACGPQENLN